MADVNASQNFSEYHDPQEKPDSGDDTSLSQERQPLLDRLPQSLIEWLALFNQGYLVLAGKISFLKHSTSIHLCDFSIPGFPTIEYSNELRWTWYMTGISSQEGSQIWTRF